MTIQELKEKYKDDADTLKTLNDLEAKVNKDYVKDNIALNEENKKLKLNNELLYNQIMNGGKRKEEEADTNAPAFKDYTDDIMKVLRKTE